MEQSSQSEIEIYRMRHNLCKMWFVCDDNVQTLMDCTKYWMSCHDEAEDEVYIENDHSLLYLSEDDDMKGIVWKEYELADALCDILDEVGIDFNLSDSDKFLAKDAAGVFTGRGDTTKDCRYCIVVDKKVFNIKVWETYAEILYKDMVKKYPDWNKEGHSRMAEWISSKIKLAQNGGQA